MRKASRHPTLSSMANSGCLLLSGSGMLPHSLQCPPAFLYLPESGQTPPASQGWWGSGGLTDVEDQVPPNYRGTKATSTFYPPFSH
ncbi:RNA binding protein fox-1 homolog 3-like protein [Lates japonicus]|uniref:RNA binding protein fox-1 homolog 3-like protein n=1 Tax=Lates japonicus TaxID=270547 RepID=A0AAD3QXZ9_LATJO|nr:RNA binding protein fox-1 homolog 3-like protein [Lates japonicus]